MSATAEIYRKGVAQSAHQSQAASKDRSVIGSNDFRYGKARRISETIHPHSAISGMGLEGDRSMDRGEEGGGATAQSAGSPFA
jgi:hypothetical protein